MSSVSLAVKYRPKEFNEVSSQKALIKILERQLELKTYKNCIIFCGPSGTGKTTIARILANKINEGKGEPIEVDAASNNGVDNIRTIIDSSIERSLDSKYKIFIIDECHMITTQGWNAFLKCIEEPPEFTIFMFCTTDPQKIPATIINRCQVYNLSRVSDKEINKRLHYICEQEGFKAEDEGIDYIVKMSEGSMRQAISYLDKCKDYSTDITLQNVIDCLGNYSYGIMFNLTNFIIDGNKMGVINLIEDLYQTGTDLKLFISDYLEFILQLTKYCLFNDIKVTTIPQSLENDVKYTVCVEGAIDFFKSYMDKILKIKQAIRGDSDIKTTFEVMLLS